MENVNYNEIIKSPPECGLEAIVSYYKLLRRVSTLIKGQHKIPYRHEAIVLLYSNKAIVYNNLHDKLETLRAKKKSPQKELTFMENELLKRLESVLGMLDDMNVELFTSPCFVKYSLEYQSMQNFMNFVVFQRVYRKNQLIKLQYYLRNYITKVVQETKLTTCNWKQEDLASREKGFILLDFFISFFQLNAILISDDSWTNFQKQTQISKVVDFPLTMNKSTLNNIIQKIKNLKLLPIETQHQKQSSKAK